MMNRLYHIFLLLNFSLFLFIRCTEPDSATAFNITSRATKDTSVRYAKRFAICRADSFTIIYLFANKNIADTTHRLILNKSKQSFLIKGHTVVKTPCKRIASLSSIYSNMLAELGCTQNIIAVENIDYYGREDIVLRYRNGLITELQRSSELNREKAIYLKPDVIFSFGMGNSVKEKEDKISQSGIPFVISLDHLEETPLARAEWIKFFACFVNKEIEAETYFSDVEKNYNNIKTKAAVADDMPTVFSELKFGDTWYVPAGKSYMARLMTDAGANYLWRNDTSSGSLPLSFETVYRMAKDADYWINVSMCRNLNDMLEQDKRYGDFKAFRNKKVFNNTKRINDKGYTSYWETGITAPHILLNDLYMIFNSDNNADSVEANLYYYTRLK